MKPKQNVLRSIYGTSDAFLRKKPLQICKAKSAVNFYLKKQEFSKNILNSTIRGYNYEKTIYLKCFSTFIYIMFVKNLQLFKRVTLSVIKPEKEKERWKYYMTKPRFISYTFCLHNFFY